MLNTLASGQFLGGVGAGAILSGAVWALGKLFAGPYRYDAIRVGDDMVKALKDFTYIVQGHGDAIAVALHQHPTLAADVADVAKAAATEAPIVAAAVPETAPVAAAIEATAPMVESLMQRSEG